jgi:hypothetical protein
MYVYCGFALWNSVYITLTVSITLIVLVCGIINSRI